MTTGLAESATSKTADSLFHTHRRALERYLLSLGLRHQDCDEIVQETFLALHRHLCAGGPDTNLRGWLFRVAHNHALKVRKKRALWQVLFDCFYDPEPNPEELAASGQRQRRITAIVRALPQRDRACLALRAEGFRYREIAEILGVSLGTVAASMANVARKVGNV
ncbi:RNA polymerase sigma factor [Bryobacterales bacterium F-183]|nr:RNA polymerase sigma factor [Bryobacterales bacterium F-183]